MTGTTRPRALVTGASSGIGADLARVLAGDGHDLVLVARRRAALEALAEECRSRGAGITVIAADLAKPKAAEALVRELAERRLIIDVLINNAGLGANGPFERIDPVRLSEILQVNIVALSELTRLLLPGMVARRRGSIMLVASTAAFQPGPLMAAYCASKAYVLSLGEALAYEMKDSGVTVTTVCPGATATEFTTVANAEDMPLFKDTLMHVMRADDVARLGYVGMQAGRPVVVTGYFNRVAAFLGRFSPHALSLPIARRLLSPRR